MGRGGSCPKQGLAFGLSEIRSDKLERRWTPLWPRPFASSAACYSLGMASAEDFMRIALEEARGAGEAGEVPVGAVVVLSDRVISRAGNRTIRDCDPTAHAEIVALRAAALAAGTSRLAGAELYVPIDPCAMCAGALVQARNARLVYGADDPKGGAVRSCFSVLDHPAINHRMEVVSGVLAGDCAAAIQSFFATRR